MELFNLSALPLTAILLQTRCYITVWQKTHVTDSRLEICEGMYAASPYFEKKNLAPGATIYVDGLRRMYLISKKIRYEIQIGDFPCCYYGDRLIKYPYATLQGAQRALNEGKLGITVMPQDKIRVFFATSKLHKAPKVKRIFNVRLKDAEGNPFDVTNYALWADRAPGLQESIERGTVKEIISDAELEVLANTEIG
jgi:hypothetical protein